MRSVMLFLWVSIAVMGTIAAVAVAAQPERPVWTGRYCDDATCVRDTLNLIYPSSADRAKVIVVSHCDGNCSNFWVFYPSK